MTSATRASAHDRPAGLGEAWSDLVRLVASYGALEPEIPEPADVARAEPGCSFGRDGMRDPRPASVLVLFGAMDNRLADHQTDLVPADLDVLLTQRSTRLRKHPGQIAFPGGARDPEDPSAAFCALREAQEETGLDPTGVRVIGTLPSIPLAVSNFETTPVVAWWARPSKVAVVDDDEATRVFRVPVADLLDPQHRVRATLKRPRRDSGLPGVVSTPAFTVANTLVWGFTAMVLDRLFDLLGWAEPWDRNRRIDITGWDATKPVPPIS
ncbi:NUDIX hydrolase [Parenemella sanctibonifatiensis]|uniref:Coenzyme A pyrophosphatase n=1 Tax=Parenemella sanctibonifatiensis TaxID=2016505 RepID=A0A255ED58_9ACTN|nr:CoA pyrophosphatase [Parenemella sanctibonifatiensis]OYN89499.1 coenzyme A pyrophosphatase [Parenemella sanctibonifatiensis]